MSQSGPPTFSICIPNYNYGRYIGETIQSVLDQTYPNFEIIVADNASTDDSVSVVESFKDKRIRLVRNRYNIGFAPNLQRATECAQMQFINLLSSDDQMKPNALEVYAGILEGLGEQADRAVIYSDTEWFNERGEITMHGRKARDGFYNEHRYVPSASTSEVDLEASPYQIYRGRDV